MDVTAEGQADETISLSDVLVTRDSCLPEDELWALCRECCLVLEVVNNSPDMFQTLCVTPDTVAFDQVGNVCFLDLDVDPEPIYIPPEYSNAGNNYKSHLFSLGMTLLYAAEYNVDRTTEAISSELRDLLGRMTADSYKSRPDLESVITLCEEQLCGQSSQEVCCGIAAIAGFGLPPEDYTISEATYIDANSPEDFSHADTYANSEQGDTTCYDDIPDLTEDISQAESLTFSDQGELISEQCDDPGGSNMESHHKQKVPQDSAENKSKPKIELSNEKPIVPEKPKSLTNIQVENIAISALSSEEDSEGLSVKQTIGKKQTELVTVTEMDYSEATHINQNVTVTNGSAKTDANGSVVNGEVNNKSDRKSKERRNSGKDSKKSSFSEKSKGKDKVPAVTPDNTSMTSSSSKTKRSRRKQAGLCRTCSGTTLLGFPRGGSYIIDTGFTIAELLDALERHLEEPELWALCKEGIAALQRKKKHLPAYLSPDTLLIRESGTVSFKAIPEEKPLEVIFMAPELQSKGELSEKTCLYGLSVTLRCAAGKKYAQVSSMKVCTEMKDLLRSLSDTEPGHRPELAEVAKICVDHSNGTGSEVILSRIFQEALDSLVDKENIKENSNQPKPAPKSTKDDSQSKLQKPSAFKPVLGSSFQPVKPAPIGPEIGGGAFAPVPRKFADKENSIPEPRIPSAFSSPATHFKPIVLQQTQTAANQKPAPVKEEPAIEKDQDVKTSTPQKIPSPDSSGDKDKEVVKKLKELKKNLMKHRQPTLAKDIENEDKSDTKGSQSAGSTLNKKSSAGTKKSGSSRGGDRTRKRSSVTGEALDSLLKEIQKQGQVPDTNSLASAIAQYLQEHLGHTKTAETKPAQPQPELDMTVTSGHTQPGAAQPLPNLDIPAQYHPQLVGQTMTLPMQYGGNMFTGFPQVQLQQDPVTGYIQLVPVNIIPMRPPSNAGSVHSQPEPMVSPALGSQAGSMGRSPHPSPKFPNKLNQNDSFSAISNKSDPSSNKGKIPPPHGRTARDLVNKTANLRAKNLGRNSARSLLNVPDESGMNGLSKWKSDHTLHSTSADEFYPDSENIKRNSAGNAMGRNANLMYDDMLLHHRSLAQYGINPNSYRSPEFRTHSNSSSPSPSKDSGLGGMNFGGFRGYPMEASLMDRLLSNVNVKQQRSLGRIVHLLREEFAFDGYMENGVEDLAMAEYISSLGDLKWETFSSAISEKYSDLYWGTELLANLYNAVNGARPLSGSRSHMGPKIPLESQPLQRADSSSSHSDQNDHNMATMDRLRPGLSPLSATATRPHSAQARNQLDTSDSTDTENYGKKRKFKTKHQLDKNKSSSNNQLVDNTAEVTKGSKPVADSRVINVLPNDISKGTQPVSTNSEKTKQSSDSVGLKQHLSADQLTSVSPSVSVTNTAKPQSSQSAVNLNRSHDSLNTNSLPRTNTHAQNGQVNSLSPGQVNSLASNPAGRLSREVSVSSHSSSQSDIAREGEGTAIEKKGHVVYHWAMIQLSMSPEVERFMQGIDEQNEKMLLSKLTEIEQQIKLEKRTRKKTQRFYKNLRESNKGNEKTAKGERSTIEQISKDITEMTHKIGFLDLCKSHLQMLLAELQGIDVSYLHAIAICAPGEPLLLRPRPDNPLLQFQTLREPQTGCEIQALHAGSPDGLMAYLFASTALSDGYIHQFLFCYRYFTMASDVLNFLIHRYASSIRAGSTDINIGRLQQRVVDLLHFWLEGYYSIDFQYNQELLQTLRNFIKDYIKEESEGGQSLLSLLSNCSHGKNLELSSADPDESEMHFWQREEPKQRWESFRSLVKGKQSNKKSGKVKISAIVVERCRRSDAQEDVPKQISSRRSDSFTLNDFTAQTLAEQLCLIEQGIFQLTHPVHYLDSKFRGVGVAMTMKGLRTPSVARRSAVDETNGLFKEPLVNDTAIKRMIDHADEISHWVAGEIVACSNPKTQIAVLSKFLFTAQSCMELRNFATCMAILDGLENLIVKQLPAWKHLPTKCVNIKGALESSRMFLKNDPMSLMQQGKDCHHYPTIPSVIYFLLHIQQLEIGGFKLANQMYKWGKMRSIAQVIDQVRIFREHMYGFEANHLVQDALRHRIREMNAQDIHLLASQHEINYTKMSGSGISGAFKKMKGKLQSK